MKAMILCAGFGKRLKPITDFLPKPLILYANRPIIEYTFDFLKKNNITDIVINTFHLGKIIKKQFGDGKRFGLNILYSNEPAILGTAGAIKAAEKILGNGTFLLINGDIIFTMGHLNKFIQFHKESNATATLLLRKNEPDKRYGTIYVNDDGLIVRFLDRYIPYSGQKVISTMFTGMCMMTPSIFDLIPPNRYCDISKTVYPEILKQNRLFGYMHQGYWQDMGSYPSYMSAHRDAMDGMYPACGDRYEPGKKIVKGAGSIIDNDSNIGPYTYIGDRCLINKSDITNCVVWDGVSIIGSSLHNCIVLSDISIKGLSLSHHVIFKGNGGLSFFPMLYD